MREKRGVQGKKGNNPEGKREKIGVFLSVETFQVLEKFFYAGEAFEEVLWVDRFCSIFMWV